MDGFLVISLSYLNIYELSMCSECSIYKVFDVTALLSGSLIILIYALVQIKYNTHSMKILEIPLEKIKYSSGSIKIKIE